jgi:hypothetical protein
MKRAFQIIIPIVFILLLVFAAFQFGFIDLRKFPEKTGLKQVTLNCSYSGKKLTIQEKLYQSIDEYYSSDPKKRFMNYGSYVSSDKEDMTIKELTRKIQNMGSGMGLTEDQTMDLATCFVQNIPYDSEKAKVVLSTNTTDIVKRNTDSEYKDRFPYETLYDNEGICTDKSYLEAAIIKEMGYGTAILTFDKEKHMAVGIKTPSGYQTFDTGYSYIETTNIGYKVGQLPAIDEKIGKAEKTEIDKVKEADSGQNVILDLPKSDFSPPSDIINISDGKEYKRVIEIAQEINRIKELTSLINTKNEELSKYSSDIRESGDDAQNAKKELEESEAKVNRAKKIYNQNPTDNNYNAYTKAYDEYQSVYGKTRGVINIYNAKINTYNLKVNELNSLIDEYNNLVKND